MNDTENQANATAEAEEAATGNAGAENAVSAGTEDPAGSSKGADAKKKGGAEEHVSKEQISAMIREAFSEYEEQQKKAQTEAEKLSNMNAQQKAEYERDNYRSELEALQSEVAIAKMQSTARAMLTEKGIHAPDNLIAAIVTDNAETTKKNVESFSEMYQKAVEEAVREKLKSSTPKTGKSASKMTKEQIFAIKDNAARLKAINENMDLFH